MTIINYTIHRTHIIRYHEPIKNKEEPLDV